MSNVLRFPVEQVRVRTMPRPRSMTALEALAGAVPAVAEAVAEKPGALISPRGGSDGARSSLNSRRAPSPPGLRPIGSEPFPGEKSAQ